MMAFQRVDSPIGTLDYRYRSTRFYFRFVKKYFLTLCLRMNSKCEIISFENNKVDGNKTGMF